MSPPAPAPLLESVQWVLDQIASHRRSSTDAFIRDSTAAHTLELLFMHQRDYERHLALAEQCHARIKREWQDWLDAERERARTAPR